MTIRFDAVQVRYRTPTASGQFTDKLVVDDLTLDLTERRIAVIGANGSGKSTMLRLINGLVAPSVGRVVVDGLPVAERGAQVRKKVGFVFTDPASQLVMPTPVEDVELSLRRTVKDKRERQATAVRLLEERGVGYTAHQSIYDLSGGERQLVALTSVLAVEPSILVLDEPTTLLDLRKRLVFHRVLDGLPQQLVIATHDLELAARCERVLVFDHGRVVFDAAPDAAIAWYRRSMEAS